MTQAETARECAMQIEAKKDGLTQLQSGEWVLKLKLHAADIPAQLLTAAMGTRYMLAVVEIGDNEEPVQTVGKSYAQQAALCCKEPAFWEYCWGRRLVFNVAVIINQLITHFLSFAQRFQGHQSKGLCHLA